MTRADLSDVHQLLQDVSIYIPKENLTAIWNRFTGQERAFAVTARSNDCLIAFGTVFINTNIRGGSIAFIEDVVVRKEQRRSGVGKALVDYLSSISRECGCYKIVLQCKEGRLAFYEKCEFTPSGLTLQKFISQNQK